MCLFYWGGIGASSRCRPNVCSYHDPPFFFVLFNFFFVVFFFHFFAIFLSYLSFFALFDLVYFTIYLNTVGEDKGGGGHT